MDFVEDIDEDAREGGRCVDLILERADIVNSTVGGSVNFDDGVGIALDDLADVIVVDFGVGQRAKRAAGAWGEVSSLDGGGIGRGIKGGGQDARGGSFAGALGASKKQHLREIGLLLETEHLLADTGELELTEFGGTVIIGPGNHVVIIPHLVV